MKVFITNPPWKVDGRSGVRAGSRWPHMKIEEERDYLPFPFYLAYAAAVLKRDNIDVKLCDAIAEGLSKDKFFERIRELNPDAILIETSTPSLDYDLGLIGEIRGFFHGDIILTGPEGNIYQPSFLENNALIDFILVGEYEYTLLDLIRHREAGESLKDVAGLIYRDDGGRVVVNPRRPIIRNLDELPWPLRDKLPMTKYEDRPGGIPAPSAQMWATRGCPYSCSFCIWPQLMYNGNEYRTRVVKDVVDEMQHLVEKGFKSIYFDDDTFNLGKKRMLSLCREIRKRKLGVPWAIMARADTMDREVLEEMRAAGLMAVKYGIESGEQKLVDNINKALDLEKAREGVKITRDLGIFVHLTFTFGLPGETSETIERTIDFALELDPDSVQFSITTPFPGTEYYRELERKNHLVSRSWADFDGNYASAIRTETLSPQELVEARERAYRRWQQHKESKFVQDNLDLAGVLDGEMAYKGPFHAQIDLTNRCNNNCIACWCYSPLLGEMTKSNGETLAFSVVTGLIEELASMGTCEVYLAGGGEPFMHPRIMEVIELIKRKGMLCHVNTNFTLVTRDKAERLIKARVDHLIVSLWAATPETYEKVHPNKTGDTFNEVKEVLRFLIAERECKPYIKVYNVIFNQNYHEFEDMIKLALELNVDTVEFTVVDTIPGKTDSLLLSEEERGIILNRIGYLKESIPYDYEPHEGNYIFHFPEGKDLTIFKFEYFIRRLLNANYKIGEYDSNIIKEIPCYIGWLSTRILGNGDVNVCLKAHKIPVGNINLQSFRDIWNGEKQREFRRKAIKVDKNDPLFSMIGNYPKAKIGCYKGCDDITRNVVCHSRMEALLPELSKLLKDAQKQA